jgi:hypothetical protein
MPTRDDQLTGINIEREIRAQIPRPQFPHGNYIGMMDELASDLNLFRGGPLSPSTPSLMNGQYHIATPFAYTPLAVMNENPMIGEMHSLITQCHSGYLRSRVVFQNMIGHWNFRREINNSYDPTQSGYVTGTASFLPAVTTEEEMNGQRHSILDGMKYREDGTFTMTNRVGTSTFTIQREDFYTHQQINDTIEIYFMKNSQKEKHFLTLRFAEDTSTGAGTGTGVGEMENQESNQVRTSADEWWTAESDHWCAPDTYTAVYRFQFHRIHLEQIVIEIKCRGPTKDYSTKTIYMRPSPIVHTLI